VHGHRKLGFRSAHLIIGYYPFPRKYCPSDPKEKVDQEIETEKLALEKQRWSRVPLYENGNSAAEGSTAAANFNSKFERHIVDSLHFQYESYSNMGPAACEGLTSGLLAVCGCICVAHMRDATCS